MLNYTTKFSFSIVAKLLQNRTFRLSPLKLRLLGSPIDQAYSPSQSGWINVLLNLAELINFMVMIALLLGKLAGADYLDLWVGLVIVWLAIRFSKVLLFGFKQMPAVKFDLTLLTAITLLLVGVIMQGTANTLVSFGGTNIWGVGVLLLAGASIYLIHIFTRRSFHTRLLVIIASFTASLLLLGVLSSSRLGINLSTTQMSVGYSSQLAFIVLLLSLTGLKYYRAVWSRLVLVFSLIISALVLIVQFNFTLVFLLALTALFAGLMLIRLQSGNILKMWGNLNKDLGGLRARTLVISDLIYRNLGLFLIFLAIVGLMFTLIGALTTPRFAEHLQSLANSYTNLPRAFTDVKDVILGKGLSPATTSGQSLFLSYGVIGLLAGFIMSANILRQLNGALRKAYQESHSRGEFLHIVALALAIIFIFVQIIFNTLSLPALFLFVLLLAITYNFQWRLDAANLVQQNSPQNSPQISNFLLARINNSALREVVILLRVILIAFVVLSLPAVVSYLQALY